MLRAALGILALALSVPGSASAQECVCPESRVLACGHRGTGSSRSSNPFPENTIPSLLRAEEEGADVVELDVLLSADGVLHLMHDDTVDRTTDGSGCVNQLSSVDLASLDASIGSGAVAPVPIPTLADVLRTVEIGLNIEVKVEDGSRCAESAPASIAEALLDTLALDPRSGRYVEVSSFDFGLLLAVRARDPEIRLALLTLSTARAADAAAAGFQALNLTEDAVDVVAVAEADDHGLEVAVWTVNSPESMRNMLALGLHMVITDDPDVLHSERLAACDGFVPEFECDEVADPPDEGCSWEGANLAPTDDPVDLLALLALLALVALTSRRRR